MNAAGGGGSSGLGFHVRGQLVDVGSFVSAVVYFVIFMAVVYFAIVVPYTKAKERFFPAEVEGKPADVALLEEIRDLLASRGGAI